MFTIHCSTHGGRVLLGPESIESLVNGPEGTELHWICSCGERGIERFHHSAEPVGA